LLSLAAAAAAALLLLLVAVLLSIPRRGTRCLGACARRRMCGVIAWSEIPSS
jgi:hypothetical protein